KDYLNAAPGSPTRTQLETNEPQLTAFINKNSAALGDAVAQMGATAQQFASTQTANTAAEKGTGGGIQIDTAKALLPNYGQLQAGAFDPKSNPVYAVDSQLTGDAQKTYEQNLNQLVAKDPTMAQQL